MPIDYLILMIRLLCWKKKENLIAVGFFLMFFKKVRNQEAQTKEKESTNAVMLLNELSPKKEQQKGYQIENKVKKNSKILTQISSKSHPK